MTTCKDCLHIDACKQWYPPLPDKYHDGCEHFISKLEYKPIIHGQWKNGNPYCPTCGKDKFAGLDADIWADWQPDYCPNCGCKMF